MSDRPEIRIRKNPSADEPLLEMPSQSRRAEAMRFLLKVDRQIKSPYPTFEVAEEAALAIKHGHPIVQVAVYDTVDGINTPIKLSES